MRWTSIDRDSIQVDTQIGYVRREILQCDRSSQLPAGNLIGLVKQELVAASTVQQCRDANYQQQKQDSNAAGDPQQNFCPPSVRLYLVAGF